MYVGRVGIPMGRVGWGELVGGASLLWGELTRNRFCHNSIVKYDCFLNTKNYKVNYKVV